MKAMCIDKNKNFAWQDVPDQECHDEFDVKIAVKACAVNHAILERGENRGKVVLTV